MTHSSIFLRLFGILVAILAAAPTLKGQTEIETTDTLYVFCNIPHRSGTINEMSDSSSGPIPDFNCIDKEPNRVTFWKFINDLKLAGCKISDPEEVKFLCHWMSTLSYGEQMPYSTDDPAIEAVVTDDDRIRWKSVTEPIEGLLLLKHPTEQKRTYEFIWLTRSHIYIDNKRYPLPNSLRRYFESAVSEVNPVD